MANDTQVSRRRHVVQIRPRPIDSTLPDAQMQTVPANRAVRRTARRTHSFTESVIREMTRVAQSHGAINLAQGFPDFPCPDLLKGVARDAVSADVNQYAITWGAPRLRKALEHKYRHWYGMTVAGGGAIPVVAA